MRVRNRDLSSGFPWKGGMYDWIDADGFSGRLASLTSGGIPILADNAAPGQQPGRRRGWPRERTVGSGQHLGDPCRRTLAPPHHQQRADDFAPMWAGTHWPAPRISTLSPARRAKISCRCRRAWLAGNSRCGTRRNRGRDQRLCCLSITSTSRAALPAEVLRPIRSRGPVGEAVTVAPGPCAETRVEVIVHWHAPADRIAAGRLAVVPAPSCVVRATCQYEMHHLAFGMHACVRAAGAWCLCARRPPSTMKLQRGHAAIRHHQSAGLSRASPRNRCRRIRPPTPAACAALRGQRARAASAGFASAAGRHRRAIAKQLLGRRVRRRCRGKATASFRRCAARLGRRICR